MIDHKQFLLALDQIAEEKKIPREKIIDTLEMALAAAYKKDYAKRAEIIRTKFDVKTGKFEVFQVKKVVDQTMIKSEEELAQEAEEPLTGRRHEIEEEFGEGEIKKVRFNPDRHIMFEEAAKINPDLKPGDELVTKLEPHEDFGRIAAQTAKQVITQRIREAERDAVFTDYKTKEGEIVSGIVQQIEGRTVYVDLDRVVGVLYPEEQIAKEFYRLGARLRVYVVSVQHTAKGPLIILSRSHPKFVAKLFEAEVPEISASAVEVKAIAREAGSRTKIAVVSHQKGVDPIGSLVGHRGTRVNTVIAELGGEKIDILEWSEDAVKFVAAALSPAKVMDVELDPDYRSARVLVPEDQLSLAIGRGGQNVRLAARLTGWRIDVRSATAPEEVVEAGVAEAEAGSTEAKSDQEKAGIIDGVDPVRSNLVDQDALSLMQTSNGVEKVAEGVEIIHGETGKEAAHTEKVEQAVEKAEEETQKETT